MLRVTSNCALHIHSEPLDSANLISSNRNARSIRATRPPLASPSAANRTSPRFASAIASSEREPMSRRVSM
jgi:hypothetical protein